MRRYRLFPQCGSLKRFAGFGAFCLALLGGVPIVANVLGIFCPFLISPAIFRAGYAERERKISARACWEQLARKRDESNSDYVARANRTVYDAHVHTNQRNIFLLENWLLWTISKAYPPAGYTQDAHRIVRSGGGLCGQVALVLMLACRENGIEARQLGLGGHVVLEAKTERGWRICDPDYGVVLPMSLSAAEDAKNAEDVRRIYADAGYPPENVAEVVSIYQTPSDNVTMPLYGQISPRLWTLERTTEYLKWIVPVLFLAAAGAIFPRARKRASPTGR